ncbi:G-protein alpha subunit [Plasmodiophora brassicae]
MAAIVPVGIDDKRRRRPCCQPSCRRKERSASVIITRNLERDRQREARVPRVLFLGCGESGKSTLCKQLRFLHGVPYPTGELVQCRAMIHQMAINDVYRLVLAASSASVRERLGAGLVFPHNVQKAMYKVQQWSMDGMPERLTDDVVACIYAIWMDPGIRRVYDHRELFHMSENVQHFFDKIATIALPSWLPSEMDILISRVKTTGIHDEVIVTEGTMIRIIDVGGQRSERRKWLNALSDVHVVMFVVAGSDYDLKCVEDNTTNRALESLDVFKQVCKAPSLREAGLVVLFNKTDLFKKKLKGVPFGEHMAGYRGDGSFASASQYYRDLYQTAFDSVCAELHIKSRPLKFYDTTAIDKDNIKLVFHSAKSYILQQLLRGVQLLK